MIRWESGPGDPDYAGIGSAAGTVFRYYYDPERGRPILYRHAYTQPRDRREQSQFRIDRAEKVEKGTEEYRRAIAEINTAYGVEGE